MKREKLQEILHGCSFPSCHIVRGLTTCPGSWVQIAFTTWMASLKVSVCCGDPKQVQRDNPNFTI